MILNYAGKNDAAGVPEIVSVEKPTLGQHVRDLRPVFKFIVVLAVLTLI